VKAQNQSREGDKLYDIIEMQLKGEDGTIIIISISPIARGTSPK